MYMAKCRLWVQAEPINILGTFYSTSNKNRLTGSVTAQCHCQPAQHPAKAREPNIEQKHVPQACRIDPSLPLRNHPHTKTQYIRNERRAKIADVHSHSTANSRSIA